MKHTSIIDEINSIQEYLASNTNLSSAFICFYKKVRIELKESLSFRIKKHLSLSPELQNILQKHYKSSKKGSTYSNVYKQMYEFIRLDIEEFNRLLNILARPAAIDALLAEL